VSKERPAAAAPSGEAAAAAAPRRPRGGAQARRDARKRAADRLGAQARRPADRAAGREARRQARRPGRRLVALNLLVFAFTPDWYAHRRHPGRSLLARPIVHMMLFRKAEPVSDYLELLPAVDIADGQAVQLVQGVAGSEKRFGDPVEAALRWQEAGAEWIHLVDLDAAFGRGTTASCQAEIVGTLDIQVEMSGGIRDDESLEAAMATGCRRVNIGTAALEQPEWCAGRSPSTATGWRRPRRARPHPGRPRLDPEGGDLYECWPGSTPRAARATSSPTSTRTACSRAQPRSCCATSARPPTGRSSPRAASPSSTTSRRCMGWCRTASRARSSAPRSTRAGSRLEDALALTEPGTA
jgi:hypothetical protein